MVNYLYTHRERKHYSLAKLSKKVKIPISVLSYIEQRLVEPNDRVKFMLAKALKVKVEHLFPEEILPGPGLRKARPSKTK